MSGWPSLIVASRFCSIQFTVTFDELKNIVCYTGDLLITQKILPTRPPSTMFVTMTMIQTPWSHTVRQKSPNELATGPETHLFHVIFLTL